ncbi:MAG TPA: peptidylprolyl isomerase, partial [Flavobacteriales bacterium]
LRVLAAVSANDSVDPLTPFLADPQPVVRTAAVEALAARPCSEAITRITPAVVDRNDPRSWIPVYGLLERCTLRDGEVIVRPPVPADAGPYIRAALIDVATKDPQGIPVDSMVALFSRDVHPVLRQAGLQGAIRHARDVMARSRYATREAQYAQLGQVLRAAIATGDAGLISAAAEELAKEEPDAIRVMLDPVTERKALEALAPIRDLEARLLLQQVVAKRDGSVPPANQRPAFNHPIAKDRLRALEQGQQYRIVTTQGEVIIATDVNGCPGTSLAFDSLVVAGYYNGRSFHRMVPNFVVQGGCPRGDGYGGMDWTLRTEIGWKPFTAGSVGLASAGPDTESCQFFITHSATPHLDGRYTRFGEVVSGMDVVWKLRVGDVMERVERIERP